MNNLKSITTCQLNYLLMCVLLNLFIKQLRYIPIDHLIAKLATINSFPEQETQCYNKKYQTPIWHICKTIFITYSPKYRVVVC